jgi:TonB family protein
MITFRIIIVLSLSFAAALSASAQTVTTGSPRGAVVYATYAAKPDYPYLARVHHVEGSGVFAVHIAADGKVSAVDAVQSTGNAPLDNSAITAFRKWRFRPPGRPTKVEIPITFLMFPGVERSHPLHPTRSE